VYISFGLLHVQITGIRGYMMLTNRQGITMIHQKVNLFIFYAHILEAACTEALNFNQTCYSWLKFLSINPEWWHFHIDFWRYGNFVT